MANENNKEEKTLSLKDLGLEEEATPAKKVAEQKAQEQQTTTIQDNGVEIKIEKVDMSQIKEDEPEKPKKNMVVRPNKEANNGEPRKLNVIKDVNKIAKVKTRDKTFVNPAKQKLDELSVLADKGIDRTKKELTAPNGRIAEGKEKYINDRYVSLLNRAKESPNLAKKLEFYENAIKTDPAFDGITEYEHKGYILFKVANDRSIGIDDKSFGLAQESIRKNRKSSAAMNKDMDSIINSKEEVEDLVPGDENTVVLGSTEKLGIPVRKSEDVAKEFELEAAEDVTDGASIDPSEIEETPIQLPTGMEDISNTSTSPLLNNAKDIPDEHSIELLGSELEKNLIDPDETVEDEAIRENNEQLNGITESMKEFGLSEESLNDMATEYYKDAASKLSIANDGDIDAMFKESSNGEDISLNAALKILNQQHPEIRNPLKSMWPLMATGVPIVSTAFSGQEMSQFLEDINTGLFNPDGSINQNPDIEKLRSIFTTLFRHYVNPAGLSFTQWLRSISSADFGCLIFSQYNAQFSHNNFISYQCQKKGCSKLYLENRPIMDMVVFNDDEAKDRFNRIMRKEAVPSGLYKTPPIPINDTFAFSFAVPSIYSMNFERSSLSQADQKKYSSIVNMLPAIDSVYILDHRNKKRQKINFGVVPKSLEQTTLRKVNGIMRIMMNFTMDQRSKMLSEYMKILRNMSKEYMSYQVPESKCPACGEVSKAYPIDPVGALFIRARLSTEVASTNAWL